MKRSPGTRQTSDYELPLKVNTHHNKKKRKEKVPEHEREHPRHQPYSRTNRGFLRHSLMVDGLGEE